MATTNLNEEPNLRILIQAIASGEIPPNTIMTEAQMRSLYNVLWVELYEIDQENERRKTAGIAQEERNSFESKDKTTKGTNVQ